MKGVGIAMVGAAALVALSVLGVSAAAGADRAQAGDVANGMKVYAAQKCSVCHNIGTPGKKMGPDLVNTGATRDAAWLEKYLTNPKSLNPKNTMPAVKVKGQELKDLIAYMLSLKKK
jgi:cytochrome c2